ncbi:MFS transporter [Rhodobacter sp. TJ_12]|uniref:MFS transporter n=1 Tax=Rhodobacter sp. TJ_12 TaxID=2029399 RepID=UPI003989F871
MGLGAARGTLYCLRSLHLEVPPPLHRSQITLFYAAVLLLSCAYGISLPLIAIALDGMGASTRLIGLSAAMPALGWLLGLPVIPLAPRRLSLTRLALALLGVAFAAWGAMALQAEPWLWVGARFLFGGAVGLIYRLIEYWLTLTVPEPRRGREIGFYNATFLGGIILGSALQPLLGVGLLGFGSVAVLLASVGVALLHRNLLTAPKVHLSWRPQDFGAALRLAPLAMAAALAFSMYEDIPAYLLSLFALHQGMGEGVAALTLSVCALGALTGAVPFGMLSDRIGRRPVLLLASGIGLGGAVAMPFLAAVSTPLFLAGLFLWAFGIEGIFGVSLALLADRFRGEDLLRANLAYGVVYALGALIGPLFAANLMQAIDPQGVFLAAGLIFAALIVVTLSFGRRP